MQERDKLFTDEVITSQVNAEGNYDLLTFSGKTVLTMVHPVLNTEQYSAKAVERFKADLSLHENAVSLFECLDKLNLDLQRLKAGKLSIFDFAIDEHISESNNVLKRASEVK